MLKKFFKECPYLMITLLLLNIAGVIIVFLGAFTDIPTVAKCFLIVMGIACLVGSTSAWVISLYEFEKLEMLKDVKKQLIEN